MKRIIAYVDGYNLYYGLREKGWKRFYWLNVQKLIRYFIKSDQILVSTKYFTTVVKKPDEKRLRQAEFLEALQTLPDLYIFYGQFLEDEVICRRCGHTYTTHHEKMTDVNISVELMADAFQDKFDLAILLSADSDLTGSVKTMRRLFTAKQIVVIFPPARSSFALAQAADATLHLDHNTLAKSQFPEVITKTDGVMLHRPPKWR